MKKLGKVLAISMIFVLMLSMCAMVFAGDLNDWKDGAVGEELGDLEQTAKNVGFSVDSLIQLVVKISISIIIGIIALKKLWGGDAKAKTDIKADLIKVFLVSVIAYFGIDILQKLLDMLGNAIF